MIHSQFYECEFCGQNERESKLYRMNKFRFEENKLIIFFACSKCIARYMYGAYQTLKPKAAMKLEA